jgi:hypothetical protein
MDNTIIISISTFVGIIAVLVSLRKINATLEIKATDIIVAILPIIIFLLVSGKIQKFEFGELKIEAAFVEASKSDITEQVNKIESLLPSESVRTETKGGVGQIPRLIKKETEAIRFQMGYGRYWGPAIEQYFVRLTRYPFLKYIIIEEKDGRFFCMADAREMTSLLVSDDPPYTFKDFADWINRSEYEPLKQLPGYIASKDSVSKKTDKSETLQRMEALNTDNLPVLNDKNQFAGIVNRARVTASLIIDVTKQLSEK